MQFPWLFFTDQRSCRVIELSILWVVFSRPPYHCWNGQRRSTKSVNYPQKNERVAQMTSDKGSLCVCAGLLFPSANTLNLKSSFWRVVILGEVIPQQYLMSPVCQVLWERSVWHWRADSLERLENTLPSGENISIWESAFTYDWLLGNFGVWSRKSGLISELCF